MRFCILLQRCCPYGAVADRKWVFFHRADETKRYQGVEKIKKGDSPRACPGVSIYVQKRIYEKMTIFSWIGLEDIGLIVRMQNFKFLTDCVLVANKDEKIARFALYHL